MLCSNVCVYIYLPVINIIKSFHLDRMQKVANVNLLFQAYFYINFHLYTSSCQDLLHHLKGFTAGESMDSIIHFNKTLTILSYNLQMKEHSFCPGNFQLQERSRRTNGTSQRLKSKQKTKLLSCTWRYNLYH